jgi:hypothetical protein
VAVQTGRRVGLGLLATGPLVGLTWLATALCVAGDLLLLAGLLPGPPSLGGLAWPLAITAATASAMRLSSAGHAVRRCVVARQWIA